MSMCPVNRRILSLSAVISLLLVGRQAAAQSLRFSVIERPTIEARLKEFSTKDAEREAKLKQLFEQNGCADEHLETQAVKGSRLPNVICTLPGKTDRIIIVGAHFDHLGQGAGVVDNWSGAALLPSLCAGLRSAPRQHTFVFIGFTDEERGLVGSRFYIRHLPPQVKDRIEAMVNLDSLGLSPTKVWVTKSDPKLVEALWRVAGAMKLSLGAVNADQVGATDAFPFVESKIPTITIHSITQETLAILHSRQDRLPAIKMDDYYETYRLLAGYLAYLDQLGLSANPAPKPSSSSTQ